jgi:hypothetical protein
MPKQEIKKCKWCHQQYNKLAKSHIIPKAFFNYDGRQDRFIVSQHNHKKRRPTGSYDTEILCLKCEQDYKRIDSDAADILLKNFHKHTVPFNDKRDEKCFQINNKYKNKIKRFLVYTLWKASTSQLSEFKRVELGPYEDKIRESLIKDEVFDTHTYSFIAFKVEKPVGHIFPYKDNKKNWKDFTYYVMDFGGFIFNIKIDERSTPEPWNVIEEHHHVPFIKLEKTPDKRRAAMATIIKAHAQKFD